MDSDSEFIYEETCGAKETYCIFRVLAKTFNLTLSEAFEGTVVELSYDDKPLMLKNGDAAPVVELWFVNKSRVSPTYNKRGERKWDERESDSDYNKWLLQCLRAGGNVSISETRPLFYLPKFDTMDELKMKLQLMGNEEAGRG